MGCLLQMADELRTPREPEHIEEWSDEISALLSQWGEISLCYGWLHNYSQRKYKRKYHHMSIPIIVLSTLTGTANFADSYVPDGFKQGFSACVGGLNIFCGILGTLMSFLKYAEVYEAHRGPAGIPAPHPRTIVRMIDFARGSRPSVAVPVPGPAAAVPAAALTSGRQYLTASLADITAGRVALPDCSSNDCGGMDAGFVFGLRTLRLILESAIAEEGAPAPHTDP